MEVLLRIMNALAVPIMVLNILGGIVSGIWLAVLGEWGAIGYGILALFVSGIGLGLALAPSMLLAAPAAMLGEKNKLGMYFFAFLSNLYVIAILTIWCGGVLYFFAKDATSSSIVPLLIWSYGVATGPIAWLAQKEQQGGNGFASLVSTFFAQVGYIVIVLLVLFIRVSLIEVLIVFGVIMLVGLILQFKVSLEMGKYLWKESA